MNPLIGITCSVLPHEAGAGDLFAVSEMYVRAVSAAGGLPVILPLEPTNGALELLFARLDGLLLTGGADIDPVLFGGKAHPRVYGVDPRRDEQEITLVRLAAERSKPFLGICRGVQVINVAMGGTLHTDLADHFPGALKHDYFPDIPRDYLAHGVSLSASSRLARVFGSTMLAVNSLHHQGIERTAPGLEVVGHAPDGLVEAVEVTDHPFGVGVQWHPEWMQAYQEQRCLFQAFVSAAGNQ
jgi:putative glutamine amidotransferase